MVRQGFDEEAAILTETRTPGAELLSKWATVPMSGVRVAFWTIALLLGGAQTWATRHDIFSDGISYIEIAKAYLHGDWGTAINPYWSPLYSWLLMLGYWCLRLSSYWDVAILHLVNFAAYCLCLGAAEYFIFELIRFRRSAGERTSGMVPDKVLIFAGYCTILFAGLSMVSIWYCSPDMIAMALTLTLSGLLLRFSYRPASIWLSAGVGLISGLSFLARTAFAPIFAICFAICALILYRSGQSLTKHLGIILGSFLILCGPYTAAISLKEGRFTLGESGALNYGWEVDGAARYAHWQGEPGDIGRPKHPTQLATTTPRSYTFAGPVPGTYAPWFNPAYWYDGVKPKIKVREQLEVLAVNLSVLANLSVRSAIFICLVPLVLLMGVRQWFARVLEFWPILLPSMAVISLYCLVYVERRYIASNLAILWMVALASVRVPSSKWKQIAFPGIVMVCILYTGVFVVRRQSYPVLQGLRDVMQRHEQYGSINFSIAERMKQLGLRAGDKIAYIGPAVDADWARLAGVKIVAEIPLLYERNRRLLDNRLNLRPSDIRAFWDDGGPGRAAVLAAFRRAGAKMLVTDGYFESQYVNRWARVLPEGSRFADDPDPYAPSQVNSRYVWLDQASTMALLARSGR